MINLFLKRIFRGENYTIGNLFIEKEWFSNTLEDVDRDLNKDGELNEPGEGKIPGQTAIPYGRYRVLVTWSPHFKRETPEILNVNDFTSIRMHAGSKPEDTKGCVLVGKNKVKGTLSESRVTEVALTAKLKEYIAHNEEIYINIV